MVHTVRSAEIKDRLDRGFILSHWVETGMECCPETIGASLIKLENCYWLTCGRSITRYESFEALQSHVVDRVWHVYPRRDSEHNV